MSSVPSTKQITQTTCSYALPKGVFFFSFGALILGLNVDEVKFIGFDIHFPTEFNTVLGAIALAMSALFMVTIPWKSLGLRVGNFLEGAITSRWQRYAKWLYGVVFWASYFVSWTKGWSVIPTNTTISGVVYWLGVVWFFVIPIVWLWPPISARLAKLVCQKQT